MSSAMFDQQQLATVLRLHEKSYELLKWAKTALKQGTISFSVLHTATDSTSAGRLAMIAADATP